MILFVFDIDGTITNASHRYRVAGAEPSRDDAEKYVAWLKAVQNDELLLADEPIAGMNHFADLVNAASQLVYLTSRETMWRKVTEQWLLKHNFPLAPVVMRPDGCWLKSVDFKEIALSTLAETYKAQLIVIDDDLDGSLASVCKRRGWTFLKAGI